LSFQRNEEEERSRNATEARVAKVPKRPNLVTSNFKKSQIIKNENKAK